MTVSGAQYAQYRDTVRIFPLVASADMKLILG